MTTLNIKKMEMNNISFNSTICIYGKRATGKSILVKDILLSKHNTSRGMVITSIDEEYNKFYSKIIKPEFIYNKYNPKLGEAFIKEQMKILNEEKDATLHTDKIMVSTTAFIVVDSYFDDESVDNGNNDNNYGKNKWTDDKSIQNMWINSRNLNILNIISISHTHAIPPLFRGNINYMFIFCESYNMNRKYLYEKYVPFIPTFKIFQELMDKYTNNYGCLVIDLYCITDNIEDYIYWYKANEHKDTI